MSKVYASGVKDILMCAICLDDVKEPRVLVCYHSFCTSCLKSIQLTGAGFQKKLQCPKCRKCTNVPRGMVNYLPMDCKLNELSEVHRQAANVEIRQSVEPKKSHVSNTIICGGCAQPKPDSLEVGVYYFYCNTCHDYLCYTCSGTHKDIPVFKDHELICLAGKGEDLQREACRDHSLKFKDYYCETCTYFVCTVCISISHRQHNVRPFEKHDKLCHDKVSDKETQLMMTFHVPMYLPGLYLSYSVEPFMASLNAVTEKTSKNINDAAKTFTEDIEKQRDKLVGLVERQRSTIQNMVTAHILTERCNDLLYSGQPGKLLKEYEGLLKEVDSFIDETACSEKAPELTGDSDLYDGFCPESWGNSLGSLSTKTVKEFMSEHKLLKCKLN